MVNRERDKRRLGLIDGRWLWPMGRRDERKVTLGFLAVGGMVLFITWSFQRAILYMD